MATYDAAAVDPGVAPRGEAFSTREVPWLKVGTVIDRPVTAAEAARLAGLDFEVDLRATAYRDRDGRWRENADRQHVVRADTDEPLSVVSTSDYEVVQYADAFGFIDEISPHVVAAGPLKNARQAFMVAQATDLRHLDLAPGGEADPHDVYVVLRTSHDMSRAVEAAIMTLRGRCMNQLTLQSFTQGVEYRWSIRHTKTVHAQMREAARVIRNLDRYADDLARTADRLAAIDLDVDAAREAITRVLPDRPRRDEKVDSIITAWQESPQVGFAGNGWGLVQAVGEVFEWQRPAHNRTAQSRFLGALEGSTHKVVNRTAALLLAGS